MAIRDLSHAGVYVKDRPHITQRFGHPSNPNNVITVLKTFVVKL